MKVKIKKSKYQGQIKIPSSKSYSHRYLIAAMLSDSSSEVKNIYYSSDVQATLDCMSSFGCSYLKNQDSISITNERILVDNPVFYCNESGSTLRFLIPISLTKYSKVTFVGTKKLIERGIRIYEELFKEKNIEIRKFDEKIEIEGKLTSGIYNLKGNESSQYVSGLLFSLPLLDGDSVINIIPPINSKNYIDMTLKVLDEYQIDYRFEGNSIYLKGNQKYISHDVEVEGDYSNSSFLDALNYLDNKVEIFGLNKESIQGDKVYLDYFKLINSSHPIIDVSNCIDLAPILMCLGALKNGVTLTKTNRLKIKESSRGEKMKEELTKIGVKVDIYDDYIIVNKSSLVPPKDCFNSHNDHRIVMALSLISSLFDIEIDGAEAINKSYPRYFKDLEKLGGHIIYE